MAIKHHGDLIQGSDEWHAIRCGALTASEMKHIITPGKLQPANNDKERSHLFELVAQRITKYVEPTYIGDDMLRGREDEILARDTYSAKIAPVTPIGFITNDNYGFTLGYSPDGLVGDDGQIECKSRRQKYQVETILKNEVPEEYAIQIQTGLLVSGRKWCDFISYSGGLPMKRIRVFPDQKVITAILNAATIFHDKMRTYLSAYDQMVRSDPALIPTERRIEQSMMVTG